MDVSIFKHWLEEDILPLQCLIDLLDDVEPSDEDYRALCIHRETRKNYSVPIISEEEDIDRLEKTILYTFSNRSSRFYDIYDLAVSNINTMQLAVADRIAPVMLSNLIIPEVYWLKPHLFFEWAMEMPIGILPKIQKLLKEFQEPSQASIDKVTSDIPPTYPNAFYKIEDYWYVAFDGIEAKISESLDGFQYIANLLENQGKRISAKTLYETVHPPEVPEEPIPIEIMKFMLEKGDLTALEKLDHVDDEIKKETLERYNDHWKKLYRKKEIAGETNNLKEVDDLNQQMLQICEAIKKEVGWFSRPRESKTEATLRNMVGAAITRAIKNINNVNEPLAKHLNKYIKAQKGSNPGYLPDKKIEWKLSYK